MIIILPVEAHFIRLRRIVEHVIHSAIPDFLETFNRFTSYTLQINLLFQSCDSLVSLLLRRVLE
ncbi:hypothetical protein AD943_10550 [Gluconobacter roseus]|nr:hypothetical protein AD943_10550 [Gluconobacter roseus]